MLSGRRPSFVWYAQAADIPVSPTKTTLPPHTSRERSPEADVVLMDVRMPEMDGIEATRRLARAGSPARVLVLTTYDADEYVYEAMKAGANGRLLKDVPREQLVVSQTTVKTHVAHVLQKLRLRDRVQAVVVAYESGLVQPGEAAA